MLHHCLGVLVVSEQYTDEGSPSRFLKWVSFGRQPCARTRALSVASSEIRVAERVEGIQAQLVVPLALDERPFVVPVRKQLSDPEDRREFAAVLRMTTVRHSNGQRA